MTAAAMQPAEAAELRRRARACLELAASSAHGAEAENARAVADRLSLRLIAAGLPGVSGTASEVARLAAVAAAKAAKRKKAPAVDLPPPEAGVLTVVAKAKAVKQPRHTPRPDLPIPTEPPRPLRAWQARALAAVRPALGRLHTPEEGPPRALRPVVSAFMGAGKSVFIAELARLCALKGFTVVVATPRQKLVRQLGETIQAFVPDTGLVMGGYKQAAQVIVSCYPSLPQTLAVLQAAGKRCDLLIVDECHGSEAPGPASAMLALEPRWMVGLTATPFRSDERESLSLWDEVVFRYTFSDGLRDGVVTPITPIHWTPDCIPNLPPPEGEATHDPSAPVVDDAVIAMFKTHGLPGPTLANAASIADADRFALRLTTHGFPALSIHSRLTWAEQAERIEALRTGEIAVLVHVSMLSEGADFPWLMALACRRNVQARVRFVQEVGRVCRTTPGKATGYVFDPLALMAKHGLEHPEALGNAIDEAGVVDDEDEEAKPDDPEEQGAPPPTAVMLERIDAWALSLIESLKQTGRLSDEEREFLPWMMRELRRRSRTKMSDKQRTAIVRVLRSRAWTRYPCPSTRAEVERIVTRGDITKAQAAAVMTVTGWIGAHLGFADWPADIPIPRSPAA
jgi:superfamily II DNA or RNA helicase